MASAAISELSCTKKSYNSEKEFSEEFTEAVTAIQRRAYWIAMTFLGNEADAEDAVQSAFCRAWEFRHQYRGDAPMLAWLMAIVRHQAKNHRRIRARETSGFTESVRRPSRGKPDPRMMLLVDALRKIDKQHRTVIKDYLLSGEEPRISNRSARQRFCVARAELGLKMWELNSNTRAVTHPRDCHGNNSA